MLKKCVDLDNEIRDLIRIIGVKLTGTLKHGIYDVTVREIIENNEILADA
jgi:hypothetical protein